MNIKTGEQICPYSANISDKYVCPQCNKKMQLIRTNVCAYYKHVIKPKKCTYKFKNKIIMSATEKNFTQDDVAWIKQSDLYSSLIDEEEEKDGVNILKYDKLSKNIIETPQDANAVLETMQYWGVHLIPQSILNYFSVHNIKNMEFTFNLEKETYNILSNFKRLFNSLRKSYCGKGYVLDYHGNYVKLLKNCIRLDVYEFLINHELFNINNMYRDHMMMNFAGWAAYHGQIDCLKYAYEHGCHEYMYEHVSRNAFRGGFLNCLIFSHEHEGGNPGEHEGGFPSEYDFIAAIKCGSLDCIKYAIKNRCYVNYKQCFYWAIECGQVECLQYFHECYLKLYEKTEHDYAGYYLGKYVHKKFTFARITRPILRSGAARQLPYWKCVINPSRWSNNFITFRTGREMAMKYAIEANIIKLCG